MNTAASSNLSIISNISWSLIIGVVMLTSIFWIYLVVIGFRDLLNADNVK